MAGHAVSAAWGVRPAGLGADHGHDTFGGTGGFASVGSTGVEEARRQVDRCLDAGVNLIDTANVYSDGLSEEIVGQVLEGRRDQVLVATKARMPMGDGPNDAGLSRHHLITQCEASLRRLRTDRIDLYQVHEWDGQTSLQETWRPWTTWSTRARSGYVGCSNYAGWHEAKTAADRLGPADRSLLGPTWPGDPSISPSIKPFWKRWPRSGIGDLDG